MEGNSLSCQDPLGPLHSSLIFKGGAWSPTHGGSAFTVPLFDDFMNRIRHGNEQTRADA